MKSMLLNQKPFCLIVALVSEKHIHFRSDPWFYNGAITQLIIDEKGILKIFLSAILDWYDW